MIEHIVKIYGINCKNKWIRYFTTGLTLSIFSSLVIPVIYAKNFSNKTIEILFKLLMYTLCVSKIINYCLIKNKSNNLFQLNYKLEKYEKKRLISEINIFIFSIISFYLSIVITLFGTKFNFCASFLTEILEYLNQTVEFLPKSSFSQIILIAIYIYCYFLIFWFIAIQFLFIEIKARYIAIIKDFNNELKRIVTKPDKNVIILTQRTISKFIEFKDDIKRNVDFLKYGIFIELILPITAIVMVGSHGSIFDTKCHPFSISFIVLMIGSYLWTMSYDFKVKRTENDLILNINRWLNQKYEDSDQIEIKVLERTVKQFNEQKSIDESNST
jgi:hypothetical protein